MLSAFLFLFRAESTGFPGKGDHPRLNGLGKLTGRSPFLVHAYNNRKHRMIGMTPAEAELPGWAYHIRRKQELHYSKIKRKKPKYKIGQTVRIIITKGKFDRGFTPQFKEEIFKIISISTRLPKPTYECTDIKIPTCTTRSHHRRDFKETVLD